MRSLTLLAALLFSFPIYAAKLHFWVLGSYAKADNAHAEMMRLSEKLNKPVEVRFDENLAVFRVLISAADANREDLGNQDAWLLPIDISQAEPDSTPYIEEDDTPIVILAPPQEPLYPKFSPEESLHEYCERLPGARLCQHPRIEKAVEVDRKLSEQRDKLDGVCDEITHPDWLATCRSLYPE